MAEETKPSFETMQKGMAQMYERQQEALSLLCPDCQGKLKIKDIASLQCEECEMIFNVNDLLNL